VIGAILTKITLFIKTFSFYREILIFESSKNKLKHLDVSKNKAF